MTVFSLAPAFVVVEYHSAFGPHQATYPTLGWDDAIVAGGHGVFKDHLGVDRDSDDMIKDLVNKLKAFFSADVLFDNYIIYNQPDADDIPQPVTGNSLAIAGTNVAPGWEKATQNTWSFRTEFFNLSKLVLLDSATADNFDRITNITGITAAEDLVTEWTSTANGWAGRDGGRPTTFIQIAVTLNEKLRRGYRMN